MVISAVQSNRTEMLREGSVVLNGVVRVVLIERLSFEQRHERGKEMRFEHLPIIEQRIVPIIGNQTLSVIYRRDHGQVFCFFIYKVNIGTISTQEK